MTLYEKNHKKLEEVEQTKRQIAIDFHDEAFTLNMTFLVASVRRTYEEQCLLLSQGRTRSDIMKNSFPGGFKCTPQQMKDMMKIYDEGRNKSGPIVTWTLNSEHIDGLAMDIVPINTTFSELSLLAVKWNIFNNVPGDPGHFSLTRARLPMQEIQIDPFEYLKRLGQRLLRARTEDEKGIIAFVIKNLRRRLGI